ncbi:MAG: rhodanese-like domain-containing protein [Alphaproteobacteria bacterium]|nr:rhodanese-like domain-containing protein [Alphaproteobacteria bacterium]
MLAAPLLAGTVRAAETDVIPAAALIQPAELAAEMNGTPPTILQVGFSKLYEQAHIPGAVYAGPGRSEDGLTSLKTHVEALPRDAPLVIYCGCCPWNRCPNMGAAYTALKAMGFTKLKALYIADNFGQDWVDKGYPVVRGQ